MPGSGQHLASGSTGQTPRYACFNSTTALLCGYAPDVLRELAAAIEQGGGKATTNPKHRPQIIVCGTVADAACRAARQLPGGELLPVVTKDWVDACVQRKAQVDVAPYQLKPLAGLNISSSNFNANDRRALEQHVAEAGATYSAEMFKGRCTHLVCRGGTGAKYSAAKQWGSVEVVSEAWVLESIKLGFPAPVEQFRVLPELPGLDGKAAQGQQAPADALAAPHVIADNAMFVSRPAPGAASAALPQQQGQQGQGQGQDAQQQDLAGVNTRAQRAAAAAAAAAAAVGVRDAPAGSSRGAGATAAARAAVLSLGLPDADEAPMFLQGVVLWWCGIAPGSSEHTELQAILHTYAGVRYPVLCDSVTHIMIGSQASIEELKAVQAYLGTCGRRLEVVSPAWLQLCQQEQQLAAADSRCRLQLNCLMKHAAGLGPGSAGASLPGVPPAALRAGSADWIAGGAAGGGAFASAASRGGPPDAAGGAGGAQPGAWVPEYWLHQPTDALRLFEGCWFTLAALHSWQAEHETALGYIRRLGGRVFTAGSIKPPPSCPTVFAVCPASLPRDVEAQLMGADASFRLVPPSCRVTTAWMDICVKRAELVRITPRAPLMAPLRHALPLRDFAGVRVVVSGYAVDKRHTIERLVRLLGGTYCTVLGKQERATHFMLPRWGPGPAGGDAAGCGGGGGGGAGNSGGSSGSGPSGSEQLPEATIRKISFARRHRLEMVVSEWLLECAAEGRRLPEHDYRPAGDLSLLPVLGGATQAPLGQTQLPGATQSQAPAPASRPDSAAAAGAGRAMAWPHHAQGGLPPAHAVADDAASSGAGGAVPARSNWVAANTVGHQQQPQPPPPQQQQPQLQLQPLQQQPLQQQPLQHQPLQQQPLQQQPLQQQPQQQQAPDHSGLGGSPPQAQLEPIAAPSRKRASPEPPAAQPGQVQQREQEPQEPAQQEQQPKRQRKQEEAVISAAGGVRSLHASPLADVGNVLAGSGSPPEPALLPAAAEAGAGAGAGGGATAAAAEAPAVGAAVAGAIVAPPPAAAHAPAVEQPQPAQQQQLQPGQEQPGQGQGPAQMEQQQEQPEPEPGPEGAAAAPPHGTQATLAHLEDMLNSALAAPGAAAGAAAPDASQQLDGDEMQHLINSALMSGRAGSGGAGGSGGPVSVSSLPCGLGAAARNKRRGGGGGSSLKPSIGSSEPQDASGGGAWGSLGSGGGANSAASGGPAGPATRTRAARASGGGGAPAAGGGAMPPPRKVTLPRGLAGAASGGLDIGQMSQQVGWAAPTASEALGLKPPAASGRVTRARAAGGAG